MSKKSRAEAKNQEQLNHDAFLDELTALTRKFGLKVWGCGCCDSPSLMKIEKSAKNGSYSSDGPGHMINFS